MWNTALTRLIGIKYPIVQAPMAGGVSTPQLAAAVSNAGGLGCLGSAYSAPEIIRSEIREMRRLTDKPFAINLFTPEKTFATQEEISKANQLLDSFRQELGLPLSPSVPSKFAENLQEQLQVILDERPPVFSFTFGIPPEGFLRECRKRNIRTIGTATRPAEIGPMRDSLDHVDFVVAQGMEAGGHRGRSTDNLPNDNFLGLMSLIPQLVKEGIPVIAAGGIMDGKQISACLKMGASGVSLGTAFLLCPEAGTNVPFRAALRNEISGSSPKGTEFTRAFSGRLARSLRNRFLEEMRLFNEKIPPYPYQSGLTSDIRKTCVQAGRSDFISMYAGQGVDRIREMPAAELLAVLVAEAEKKDEH